jgi:hypothetical protein
MVEAFINCIKKGKDEEVILACHGLIISIVTADSDATDEMINNALPNLEVRMKDPAYDCSSRTAVTEAFGILTFLAADADIAVQSMDTIHHVIVQLNNSLTDKNRDKEMDKDEDGNNKYHALLAQLLDSYAVVGSIVSDALLAGQVHQTRTTWLASFLDHSDLDVRLMAGEAIALIQEAANSCDHPVWNENSRRKSDAPPLDSDVLIDLVQVLATDGAKQKAKKDKVIQRATFRSILDTVENGGSPVEGMTVGETKVEISGWSSLKQFRAVRAVLKGGLQTHLNENPLLAAVFGVDGQLSGRNQQEYRSMGKANSRANKRAQDEFKSKERRLKMQTFDADE